MKYYLSLLLLCVALSAQAAETKLPAKSLFFTADESTSIDAMVAQMKTEHNNSAGIHLGAVMYYGPEDWALWLQGSRWTPSTTRPDLTVVSVEPNTVHLSWSRNAKAAARDITLHPYQTYQISSGKIVEGLR